MGGFTSAESVCIPGWDECHCRCFLRHQSHIDSTLTWNQKSIAPYQHSQILHLGMCSQACAESLGPCSKGNKLACLQPVQPSLLATVQTDCTSPVELHAAGSRAGTAVCAQLCAAAGRAAGNGSAATAVQRGLGLLGMHLFGHHHLTLDGGRHCAEQASAYPASIPCKATPSPQVTSLT